MCLVSPVMIRSAIVTAHIKALAQRNTGRHALYAYGDRQQQAEEIAKAMHEASCMERMDRRRWGSWACLP